MCLPDGEAKKMEWITNADDGKVWISRWVKVAGLIPAPGLHRDGRQKLVRGGGYALAFNDGQILVHFRLADPVYLSTRARPGDFDPVNLILAGTQYFARVMT